MGKLDSALLFLSSTVGIIFAVIRAAINPSASIVTAIPLIILGIVLPFYYGYVRGALVRSSTVDRYRGWIFFLVGLAAYGYSITLGWMNLVLPAYVGRGAYLVDLPLAIVSVLAAYPIARRFHGFIFEVLGEPSSKVITRSAFFTVLSAILLAAIGSLISTIQVFSPSFGFGLFIFLAVALFLLRESGRYGRESFRAQFWRGSGNRTALYLLELTFGDMHVAGHFAVRKRRVLKPRNIVPSRLATRHAVHVSIHCAIVAGVCAERLRWS